MTTATITATPGAAIIHPTRLSPDSLDALRVFVDAEALTAGDEVATSTIAGVRGWSPERVAAAVAELASVDLVEVALMDVATRTACVVALSETGELFFGRYLTRCHGGT